MNTPKISIITACYNAEATIVQTIKSVVQQTYCNYEYIIIDGASKDRTMEFVDRYRENIDIVISEEDKGIYDAFNKGLAAATGDYLLYLNADDYFLDDRVIESAVQHILAHHHPNIIYGGIYIIEETSGYVKEWNTEVALSEIKKGAMIPHPATFMRRDCMQHVGGFDCSYKIAADYNLLCDVVKLNENSCKYAPIIISNFRVGGVSTNYEHEEQLHEEVKQIVHKQFNTEFDPTILRKASNEGLLKKWILAQTLSHRSPATVLKEQQIERIIIFGSGEVANLLALDCKQQGIHVMAFFDNSVRRQQVTLNGIKIVAPEQITQYNDQIQAIVFGFEGNHEQSAVDQLLKLNISSDIKFSSWRELVNLL